MSYRNLVGLGSHGKVRYRHRIDEHMTNHLLNLDFLERTKATRTRLHVQRAFYVVPFAILFVLAIGYWRELFLLDFLKRFSTADITSVRVYKEKWFHF